jgi:hypothetical protein
MECFRSWETAIRNSFKLFYIRVKSGKKSSVSCIGSTDGVGRSLKTNFFAKYAGQSVNRTQMDIRRKHVIFELRKKKHLFLDISSTNIDKLVPSLYQCLETRSIEVF